MYALFIFLFLITIMTYCYFLSISLFDRNLENNRIQFIPSNVFALNKKLRDIKLRGNPILSFGINAFQDLPYLRELYDFLLYVQNQIFILIFISFLFIVSSPMSNLYLCCMIDRIMKVAAKHFLNYFFSSPDTSIYLMYFFGFQNWQSFFSKYMYTGFYFYLSISLYVWWWLSYMILIFWIHYWLRLMTYNTLNSYMYLGLVKDAI